MTIWQIRKEIKTRKAEAIRMGFDLADWYDDISYTIETLWRDGFITNFTNMMLKYANSYQITSCNYKTCHISQTYNLHCIKMDRTAVKEFAEFSLK